MLENGNCVRDDAQRGEGKEEEGRKEPSPSAIPPSSIFNIIDKNTYNSIFKGIGYHGSVWVWEDFDIGDIGRPQFTHGGRWGGREGTREGGREGGREGFDAGEFFTWREISTFLQVYGRLLK
jgi:hypothetical protein